MACACKVNRQIEYLQKRYGVRQPKRHETHIVDDVKLFFYKLMLLCIVIPFIPLMIIYVIIRRFFTKEPINLYKLTKLIR